MFYWLFMTVPLFIAVLVFVFFVLPCKIRWAGKLIWAVMLLFGASKFAFFKVLGGHAFSPDLPAPVIIGWNFAYAWLCMMLVSTIPGFLIRSKRWRMMAVPAMAFMLSIWGMYSGMRVPQVREVELRYKNLPESLEGYRILQLTDMHISRSAGLWRSTEIVKRANEANADLVCMTGDYADGQFEKQVRNLEPLKSIVSKDGIYAVTGNHEYYFNSAKYFDYYRKAGFRFLHDECVFPRKDLAVSGVSDCMSGKCGDLAKAFHAATNGEFRVFLQHRPYIFWLDKTTSPVDLQLSGHTHGGIAPLLSILVRKVNGGYVRGVYKEGNGYVCVSSGAGQWSGFPLRFLADSEIPVYVLRKERDPRLEAALQAAKDNGWEINDVKTVYGCARIEYVLRPTDKSYIRCQIAFPLETPWRGHLWGTGNGGAAGKVWMDWSLVKEGNVVVHCDMGSSKGVHGNHEALVDFGWRATHLMTTSAKELTKAFFGRLPDKSYFIGTSTGGGQGFHEALRFPDDYNGIISYVPANTRMPLHVYFAWNLRLMKRADGTDIFSDEEFAAVEEAAIDWFADKDREYARGKFLTDSRYDAVAEKGILDIARKKCPSLENEDKLERLHKMFVGPVINGKHVHSGVPFSASFKGSCDNQWMLEWFIGYERPLWSVTDGELEAWMREWGGICDASGAGIKAFAARGGKMLVIGGLEDSVVPYQSMIDWYERAREEMGNAEELAKSCKLYLLPGRAHGQGRGCGGINNDKRIIIDWVEKGVAPNEVNSDLRGGGTLKVRPYPDCF